MAAPSTEQSKGCGLGSEIRPLSHQHGFAGAGDGLPVVVIAFARSSTDSPAPGTYALGRDGDDRLTGSVEVYGDPQREFDITAGELVIAEARGDAMKGRFTLTAEESSEAYTTAPPVIRIEGTFESKPAK